jgi:aspartyl-tRNA(Asn)/glutamyl-tRNA(Gln) amidotransferase subunit B
MPEMPDKRLVRYMLDFELSETDASIIINEKVISDFFDGAILAYNNPKAVANFIISEMLRRINLGEIALDDIKFTPDAFAKIVMMAETDIINKSNAKDVFRALIEKPSADPETLAKDMGFIITTDMDKVTSVIKEIMAANEKAVAQYRNGETKVFGFLMGQCSKALKGAATSKQIKDELENALK